MKKTILLVSLMFLTSCASYINRVHKQLDREEMKQQRYRPAASGAYRNSKNPNFDLYRNGGRELVNDNRRKKATSANRKYAPPSTKRLYRPLQAVQKRYTAKDLTDSGNQASLWATNEDHLFHKTSQKRSGDIVLIEVAGRLKNEITLELKRAFPDPPKRKKKKDAKGAPGEEKKETTAAAPAAPAGNKVHDKISSVIIEEINNDHLLLRGRKNLLYKNRKRLIEIQALISRRDISDDNSILSDNILESTVNVLR